MITQYSIKNFSTPLSPSGGSDKSFSDNFTALRLEDLTHESIAATAQYSRKDFYKVSLISGDTTYHYLDNAHRVSKDEWVLVFTNRDIPYRWEVHNGSTCSGYACMFTDDFLPLHTYSRPADWQVFNAEGQSFFRLNKTQAKFFEATFQKMLDEQQSEYQHKYELLFLYLMETIHHALRLGPEPEAKIYSSSRKLSDAFKNLLSKQFPLLHPNQEISFRNPQAFADKLAVHTNYLNRVLKNETGKTTTQLITERIMQEAKALLIYSNWSISQISDSLGFAEATHFTQAYKKHFGELPSAIRKG
ncbi:MAG: AraC family transcriptional regulator [Chitinophagaceae bacterium]|nr:MAG: AraC family transcriptional regulator [Chitinophagaceae bacterium]